MTLPRGADALTASRVALACGLAASAVVAPHARAIHVLLFTLAAVTDIADGWWARRTATASEHGARMDSVADAFLAAGTVIAFLASVDLPDEAWVWWAIATTAALRLTVLWATWHRHRVVAIMHTHLNRASGIAAAAVAVLALAVGEVPLGALGAAAALACVAAAEELTMMLGSSLPYDRDRRGSWARSRSGAE